VAAAASPTDLLATVTALGWQALGVAWILDGLEITIVRPPGRGCTRRSCGEGLKEPARPGPAGCPRAGRAAPGRDQNGPVLDPGCTAAGWQGLMRIP